MREASQQLAPDLYRGERIGRFEVLTQLSLGGMAELLLAFTAGPGGFRKYAVVKRILPDVAGDEAFVKMFLDEARLTASFTHANIAQVFELGEDDSGLFLAMEFVAGQNLEQVTAACAARKMPVPAGFAAAAIRGVCNALHYAHTFVDPLGRKTPVIHRDVAQKNIIVGYDGSVKLLDFGIAKARGSLSRSTPGFVKGTTGYMSPEQVRGEALDGRTDVFAAGVVLYELLGGRRLFAAATEAEEMQAILDAPIPKLKKLAPHVPEPLADIAMRALGRERSDRFASALEMAQALERAAGKLLFGPEELSALMRELFADKVEATRVLLESAGEQTQSPEFLAAVRQFKAAPTSSAVITERVAQRVPSAPPPTAPVVTPAVPAAAGAVERDGQVPTWIWGLVLAVFVAGAGFLVYEVIQGIEPEGPVLQPPAMQPLALPSRSRQAAPPPPVQESAAPAPTPTPAAVAEVAPSRPARPEGSLTLVTQPAAEVWRGKSALGRTPLFKAPLPEGVQALVLVGEDGVRRTLKVPIKRGQNTALRLELTQLPVQ